MTALLPWIAVIVTIVAGWALLKRYSTHMVLLFSGLVILICVALAGVDFLPKGVKTSGFWLFDIFATLKSIATKQSAGTGFLIMTAGGFAAYMDRIGAAKALVDVAVKPLSLLKAPYLVLAGGYVVGHSSSSPSFRRRRVLRCCSSSRSSRFSRRWARLPPRPRP